MSIHNEQHSELLKIAQYVFAIPAHNANVERVFSLMEIQWTDERNRLQLDTVESIIIIKRLVPNFTSMLKHSHLYLHRLNHLRNMNGTKKMRQKNPATPAQVQVNK